MCFINITDGGFDMNTLLFYGSPAVKGSHVCFSFSFLFCAPLVFVRLDGVGMQFGIAENVARTHT